MGKRAVGLGLVLVTAAACAPASAQLEVRVVHESEAEVATRDALLRLVETNDVDRWMYTRTVQIDRTQIPHSHPVLTLHTRHLGDDVHLLSTFLHEQFHWLEEGETLPAFRAAMADFEGIFPEVPDRQNGGASDPESTWRHLIVNDLEFQAMTELVGEDEARALMGRITYYGWIYDKVLTDSRVREINERHGFVLSELPRAR